MIRRAGVGSAAAEHACDHGAGELAVELVLVLLHQQAHQLAAGLGALIGEVLLGDDAPDQRLGRGLVELAGQREFSESPRANNQLIDVVRKNK